MYAPPRALVYSRLQHFYTTVPVKVGNVKAVEYSDYPLMTGVCLLLLQVRAAV